MTSLGTAVNSDGTATTQVVRRIESVGLQDTERYWRITQTNEGFILTIIRRDSGARVNLDGASDGRTVKFLLDSNVTHGQCCQIESDQGGYRIRSLNNTFLIKTIAGFMVRVMVQPCNLSMKQATALYGG